MLPGPLRRSGARRGGRLATTLAAGLLLGTLLAGCSLFGDVGSPYDAHLQVPPGNKVVEPNANLQIRAVTPAPANPQYRVIIYHNVNTVGEFVPEHLTVPVGSVVEWVWTDQYDQHNVWWFDQDLINSPTKGAGYRWAVKFVTPGTYDYYCTLHPGMLGSVVVTG